MGWAEFNAQATGGINAPVTQTKPSQTGWAAFNAAATPTRQQKQLDIINSTPTPPQGILANLWSGFKSVFTEKQKVPQSKPKNIFEKAIAPIADVPAQALIGFTNSLQDTVRKWASPAPVSSKIGSTIDTALNAANVAFSPVTSAFSVAENTPLIKYPAKAIGWVFGKAGDVGGFVADKAIDSMPLTPIAKENLKDPVHNLGGLLGQTILGGGVFKGGEKVVLKTLGDHFISNVQDVAVKTEAKTPITTPEIAKQVVTMAAQKTVGEIQQGLTSATDNVGENIKPKADTVAVSRGQLPVGTGKEKVSSLEARIKEKLNAVSPEDRAGLSTYNEVSKSENIKAAAKFVAKDPEAAMAVLRGDKVAPKGLLYNSISIALEEHIKNNPTLDIAQQADLNLRLASLRSTRAGQEISVLTERDPNSPVKYMTDLTNAKVEALGGREKLKTLQNQELGGATRAIRSNNLVKTDWNSFVESIRC
jgi:hypothetical protein